MNREKWAKNAKVKKGTPVVVINVPEREATCTCGRTWNDIDVSHLLGCEVMVDTDIAEMSVKCTDAVAVRVGDNRLTFPFWCLTRGTA